MVNYARRHPTAARNLMRLFGYQIDGTEAEYRRIGELLIPFVEFSPR